MDARRHALPVRARVHRVHFGAARRSPAGIYEADHVEKHPSGRFRWVLSTCLAAGVGLLGILVVIVGSTDPREGGRPDRPSTSGGGSRWAVPKTDKLLIPSDAIATTFVIEDAVREHRGNREFIFDKRYLRLVARLAPITKAETEAVPRLDPTVLYAPLDQNDGSEPGVRLAAARVVELLDGTLPNEDGQELEMQAIFERVARLHAVGGEETSTRAMLSETGVRLLSSELFAEGPSPPASEVQAPSTSILAKSVFEADAEALAPDAQPHAISLYASLHHAASKQGMSDNAILQALKIHAYQTDFSQRVRAGDAFEFFFEEVKAAHGGFGALLATAIASRGETRKFYRFRTPDGMADYYDADGNTSRKFLMRRPVSCENARLSSGFGPRRHPLLLQVERMHLGEDWACPPGTPILAAGNGVIEVAGAKGELGTYARILHANGYKTAYGHMSRLAPGVSAGAMVRQGQIIGYVGTSGLSSGAHVHFEVLVNSSDDSSFRHVDPTSIQLPLERQLTGKELADFRKERDRIDRLMRRAPISTRVVKAGM